MAIYEFGGLRFTSKAKVKQYIYLIRDSYILRAKIDNHTHISFLTDLLNCHPSVVQKRGPGIRYFYTDRGPGEYCSICFYVRRVDDTHTDWSYNSCLMSIGQINRAALRLVVRPQIKRLRDRFMKNPFFVSEYSGKTYPIKDLHIDHVIPFEDIVNRWANQEGIDLGNKLLKKSVDGSCDPVFFDDNLASRFYEYHKQFELRPVSALENTGELRRGLPRKDLGSKKT